MAKPKKTLKEQLTDAEMQLIKIQDQKAQLLKRETELKGKIKTLKAEIALELLKDKGLTLDDLELFSDELKSMKDSLAPSEPPKERYDGENK